MVPSTRSATQLLGAFCLVAPQFGLGQATRAPVAAAAGPPRAAPLAAPYDFTGARALLDAELPNLQGNVAVLVRQGGRELFRYQAGALDFDTPTRLASVTKTVSAAVILALADEGRLALSETLGASLPGFAAQGLGAPMLLDCWAMRHGLTAPLPFEHLASYTLTQSVNLIGFTGTQQFPPGSELEYDGKGMQCVGRVAELRTGLAWDVIASTRVLAPCGMSRTDYGQFAPNPSIPGGLRGTAEDLARFADMVLAGGVAGGQVVLSTASIERLFTNPTRGLPVRFSPFPATHPLYPNGVDPDYGFGAWVLAEDPQTQHVEELAAAGAWGSFVWFDRRRGLTATLVTDIPLGSQASLDAALGLFAFARGATEAAQASALTCAPLGSGCGLTWTLPPGATAARVYASAAPIRDVFELRAATLVAHVAGASAFVPQAAHFAVTVELGGHENTALVPGVNAL